MVSIEQISNSDIRLSRSILGCSIWSMLKKIYNSFNDDSMAAFLTNHTIVSFADVLHTLYHLKISHPCSKGKMTLFWRIPYHFWWWFWLVCSMGKMTKNGLNGGKREDYKKKRSQFWSFWSDQSRFSCIQKLCIVPFMTSKHLKSILLII